MPRLDTAGRVWIQTHELTDNMYGSRVPETERWRRYFGKNVNTAVIEQVLCNADQGFMRDLADLGAEVLRIDPHLAGIVRKRMAAVASVKPIVTPVTGGGIDPAFAKHYADMVQRQLLGLKRLRMRQTQMAWSSWHGRSALEIEWVETANPRERWRVKELHWIHPRRLSLGPEREIRINDGMWQGTGFEAVGFDTRELPFKFITCQRQLFNEYPEREGLVIPSLFYSYFKRFSQRERMSLMEMYGRPLRWIEAAQDAGVTDEVLNKARDAADDMGADTAAAFPPGVKIMMQAVAQGANNIHKETLDYCNSELSKLVLGSTNTTDGASGGGIGSEQARVHQDGETLIFTGDCDEVAGDWTEGFARSIVLLNGGPEHAELYTPLVELPYEQPPDAKSELERAKAMFDMGLSLKKSEVYERAGFTVPTEDDEVVSPPPPAPPGGDPLAGLLNSATPADTSDQSKEIRFTAWRRGRIHLTEGAVVAEVTVQGIPVYVDRPRGFVQTGVDRSGRPWTRTYRLDYGFIPNTLGGDGEGLDVFLGPDLKAPNAYWVKQRKPDGAGGFVFDEYKVFLGFAKAVDALDAYADHIPQELCAGCELTTVEQMKALLGIEPQVRLRGDPEQLVRAARVLGLIGMIESEVAG